MTSIAVNTMTGSGILLNERFSNRYLAWDEQRNSYKGAYPIRLDMGSSKKSTALGYDANESLSSASRLSSPLKGGKQTTCTSKQTGSACRSAT